MTRRSVFAGRTSLAKVFVATLSSSDCHLRCSVLIGRFHFTELLVTELETSWVKDKLNHRCFWFGTSGSSSVIPPRVSDLLGKRRCRLRLGGSKTQIRQSEIRWSRVNLQLGVAQKSNMRTKYFDTRLMSSSIHIILTVRKNLWSQFYKLGTCTEKCKKMSQNRFVLFSRLAECQRVRKLGFDGDFKPNDEATWRRRCAYL